MKCFFSYLKVNSLYVITFAISLIAIFSSLVSEYVFDIAPCQLCYYQRIPFFLSIAVSIFGIFSEKKSLVSSCLVVIFMSSSLIATYHVLVQNGVINDPCKITKVQSIDDFVSLLEKKQSCNKINWSIFGVSAALLNAGISSFFVFAIAVNEWYTRKLSRSISY